MKIIIIILLVGTISACSGNFVVKPDGTKVPTAVYAVEKLADAAKNCSPTEDIKTESIETYSAADVHKLSATGQAAYFQSKGNAQTADAIKAVAMLVRQSISSCDTIKSVASAYFTAEARKTEARASIGRSALKSVTTVGVAIEAASAFKTLVREQGDDIVTINASRESHVTAGIKGGSVVQTTDGSTATVDQKTGSGDALITGDDPTLIIDPDKQDIDLIGGDDRDNGADPNLNLDDRDKVGLNPL